jgi:hypothetical protein
MSCRACGSENLDNMHGELTATFGSIQAINTDPVYICEEVVICLDCGRAEMQVPPKELGLLRKRKAALST